MTRLNSSWEDMSEYLVHFANGGKDSSGEDIDVHGTMMSIFFNGMLVPGKSFGIAKNERGVPDQSSVCLSEIPPGQWSRLADRRNTAFGIGFKKEFVRSKGGGPIWYAYENSPCWEVLKKMMADNRNDPNADIWKLTPMIDAPGNHNGKRYFFEWEREWRHVGPLCFEPEDVEFLLVPKEMHAAVRNFFLDAKADHSGPAYLCPYIDPAWDRETITEILAGRELCGELCVF